MLIVIDGTDGSGKATQSRLLVERMKQEGRAAELFDFPQYGQKSAGLVEEYLNGKFGTADEVGPFRASIFYACDRYAASSKIRQLLAQGVTVVCNRYVTSNMGHQASKINDPSERDSFLEWLDNLEYGIFDIPRPDKVIVLYIPPQMGQKLVDLKKGRTYLEGNKTRDIHEADLNHLRLTAEAYFYAAKKYKWDVLDCAPGGVLKPVNEISDWIWRIVKPLV